jgi:hypothetical protein
MEAEAVVGFFSQIEVGAIEYRRIDDEEWFRGAGGERIWGNMR